MRGLPTFRHVGLLAFQLVGKLAGWIRWQGHLVCVGEVVRNYFFGVSERGVLAVLGVINSPRYCDQLTTLL